MKIWIVDYNVGNLSNVFRACRRLGLDSEFVSSADKIKEAGTILLPGVGAFGPAMKNLETLGIKDSLLSHAKAGKPIVGICLGFQLLFDTSSENGNHEGLGLIHGEVDSFNTVKEKFSVQVPNIGWEKVKVNEQTFEAYFTHSYFAKPKNPSHTLCTSFNRDFEFCCGVFNENICGTQFHPEISGEDGLNFLNRIIHDVSK